MQVMNDTRFSARLNSAGSCQVPAGSSVSIVDLHRIMNSKRERQLTAFQVILERCNRRVESAARVKMYMCRFDVPDFLAGHPRFDLGKCIEYLMFQLVSKGLAVQFVFPRSLIISWEIVRRREWDDTLGKIAVLQDASIASASHAIEQRRAAIKGPDNLVDMARLARMHSHIAAEADADFVPTSASAQRVMTDPTLAGIASYDAELVGGRESATGRQFQVSSSGKSATAKKQQPVQKQKKQPPPQSRSSGSFRPMTDFNPSGNFVLHL